MGIVLFINYITKTSLKRKRFQFEPIYTLFIKQHCNRSFYVINFFFKTANFDNRRLSLTKFEITSLIQVYHLDERHGDTMINSYHFLGVYCRFAFCRYSCVKKCALNCPELSRHLKALNGIVQHKGFLNTHIMVLTNIHQYTPYVLPPPMASTVHHINIYNICRYSSQTSTVFIQFNRLNLLCYAIVPTYMVTGRSLK